MAKISLIIYIFTSVISIFSLILYILGAVRYLTVLEPNSCDMTFMFEYPEYVKIKLNPEIEKQYPKYELFVYGEGYMVEKLRRMKFSGIPVLFIPGNAGSHEQVRSIASVSLRMSLKRTTSFHFDYFTVSLAKGLSALYGGILEEQTAFVRHCMQHIIALYGGNVHQVLLIGHSMGGIIAKAALLQDRSNETSLASILINLSTPRVPSVAFDKTFADYYADVNAQAHRLQQMSTTVISIGGGPRDRLVTSSQIIDPDAGLNVLSTTVPNVWRSQDHLSILWCKQLIIVLVRSLFDCVDSTGRIPKIKDSSAKLQALVYHLSTRYSGRRLQYYAPKIDFDANAEFIPVPSSHYTYRHVYNDKKKNKGKVTDRAIYLMIPLKNSKDYDRLSLDTIDLQTPDWLYACSASSSGCKWGWNLTNRSRLYPDHLYRVRKSVDLNLNEFRNDKITHIVVRIASDDVNSKIPTLVHVDMYSLAERTVYINTVSSSALSAQVNSLISSFGSSIISIKPGSLRYYLNITGIPDTMNVILQSISNFAEDDDDFQRANMPGYISMQVKELWNLSNSSISQYYSLTDADVGKINTIRLQTVPNDNASMYHVEVRITCDPRFTYKIVLRRAGSIDRLANFVRDRWFRLYPITIGLLLLAIATRMDNNEYKVPTTVGITCIIGLIFDLVFEICVAAGLLMVLAVATCCAVIFSGSMAHNLAARFLARTLAHFPVVWYDWLLRQTLDSLPIVTSFIVIVLVSSSCAAIIMLLSVLIYFFKLTRMYEDYLEELFMASLRTFAGKLRRGSRKSEANKKKDKDKENKEDKKDKEEEDVDPTTNIINHLLLFMTWYLTAGSAIPTALVWAKNFSYETRLATEDTTMFISWIILTGWASLGFVKITPPANDDKRAQMISIFQRLLGWGLLLITTIKNPVNYQWTIPPIVAIFITHIVLSRLFVKSNISNQNR